jgi:DUF218 domain
MVSTRRHVSRITSNPGFLKRLYDWLAVSDPCQETDVIFVLAGRECRKHFALRLFRQGLASTMLISVGRFEIRRFFNLRLPASLDLLAVAATTEPRRRHYFVRVGHGTVEAQRISVSRFGTLNEILAFADWLREHPSIRSAMVVSSGFHLKRVRMCCRRLVPDGVKLRFVAAHEEGRFSSRDWWRDAIARRLMVSEVVKVAVYKLLCQGLVPISALRGEGDGQGGRADLRGDAQMSGLPRG